jgi:hypothetical protein
LERDVDFWNSAQPLVLFECFSAAAEGVFVDFVLQLVSVVCYTMGAVQWDRSKGGKYLDLVRRVSHEDRGTGERVSHYSMRRGREILLRIASAHFPTGSLERSQEFRMYQRWFR